MERDLLDNFKPKQEHIDLSKSFGAIKTKNYCCPKCGTRHNDNDTGYIMNNENYPKYFNESKGATLDGDYWDWDEVHCCENCETLFWFNNGAF